MSIFAPWRIPKRGQKFAPYFSKAEKKYGIPKNLLARIAYQESRFRDDIITGQLPSKAGALGIMQIIPRWHPNVNPLNPPEAIDYAGKYLKRLHDKFGSWNEALAAYNWGEGNLRRWQKGEIDRMPEETKNYTTQIMSDIFRV